MEVVEMEYETQIPLGYTTHQCNSLGEVIVINIKYLRLKYTLASTFSNHIFPQNKVNLL
jgi:hypothetical protein